MTISLRENLIRELKGKTFRINNLGSILPGWSEGVSPEYEELHDRIEPQFDIFFRGKRRAKLKGADPAWLAVSWWPYASLEQLEIGSWFLAWVCT